MPRMKMRKGACVPFPEELFEGYAKRGHSIIANVGADKLLDLFKKFIVAHDEPLFFILELPTNRNDEIGMRSGVNEGLHNNVYYIDGCSQAEAMGIIEQYGQLLINDGMCAFGFGGHFSHDELMVGKYNVVTGFSKNPSAFDKIFGELGIGLEKEIVTAWNTFNQEHPGVSNSIVTDGHSVYELPELLKERGMYFAERRQQ